MEHRNQPQERQQPTENALIAGKQGIYVKIFILNSQMYFWLTHSYRYKYESLPKIERDLGKNGNESNPSKASAF